MEIQHQLAKVGTASGAVIAGYTWPDIAAILASVYSLVLLSEWVWKRLLKPRFFPDPKDE